MNGLQGTINFFAVAAHSGGQGGYFSPHLVYTENVQVDRYNKEKIDKFPGDEYISIAQDSILGKISEKQRKISRYAKEKENLTMRRITIRDSFQTWYKIHGYCEFRRRRWSS